MPHICMEETQKNWVTLSKWSKPSPSVPSLIKQNKMLGMQVEGKPVMGGDQEERSQAG